MRCVRGQFVCNGYSFPPKKPSMRDTRIMLPARNSLCRSPPAQMFKTDQEYRCFQRFRTQTAFQLAGFRETQLWSRIVLQASEAEPCIMHAVTALGGLKLTERPNKGKDIESPQLEFAYREYGKAIVGLKRSIQTGKSDTRTKLIASLLFTCFGMQLH